MKRLLLVTVVVLSTLGLSLAGFAWWCLSTSSGTRWLMANAGRLAGVTVTSTEQHGSLRDGLSVSGLRVAWQNGEIQAGSLDLGIRAVNPWSATLTLDHLLIDRLVVQFEEDVAPPAPDAERGERSDLLAAIPAELAVSIDKLRITDFVSRSTGDPATERVIARLIAGRYRFAGQHLNGEDVAYHSPYVELDGRFDWDLRHLHLVMTMQVRLPEDSADPELFAGLKVPTDFPAHLELDGDWNGFSGPVRFGAGEEAGEAVWLAAQASGSRRGIRFADLRGRYLGGDLKGDLELAWAEAFRLHGALAARALDAGDLIEGVTGKATFDISGELHIPYGDQPLQASIEAELHAGQFRDHALQGQASGRWLGNQLLNLEIDLAGDGTRLLAKGMPAQRVEIDLEVADLAVLHAELAGQVTAKGWLRWTEQTLTGELDGHGAQLAWQENRMGRLAFHARHGAADDRLEVTFTADDYRHGQFHVRRMQGMLSGTPAAHRLELAAHSSLGEFAAAARGRYEQGRWSGQLERLTGEATPWGAWSIAETAALSWQEGVLNIDRLRLTDNRGGQVELGAVNWNSQQRAEVSLAWQGFELAWLQPYAGLDSLSGRAAGQLRYVMQAGHPLSINGRLAARGRIADGFFDLHDTALDLDFTWDADGLRSTVTAGSAGGEDLQGRASSSAPLQWRWPIADLSAELRWQSLPLAYFDRFVDDTRFEGLSDGSLSLAFSGDTLASLSAQLSAQGQVLQEAGELGPRSLLAELDWVAAGFQARVQIDAADKGQARLQLASRHPPALAWPESGQVDVTIEDLGLASFAPLLPHNIEVVGRLGGHATGSWREQTAFELSGAARLVESRISWAHEGGQIHLPLRDAAAEWRWADDSISGTFAMNLAEHGDLKGAWRLPLAARIPADFDPAGPLQLDLDGRLQASGLLSAVGPWLVQDLRGETQVNLALRGSWATPEMGGKITFRDGRAYLPASGVQLDNINMVAELDGDRLHVAELEIHSGPGLLNGRGELFFDQWALTKYRFNVISKNLQVVNFPELQVLCNTDLDLSGTAQRLSVRGAVFIPRLSLTGNRETAEVLPSKDVVIVTAEKTRTELAFATDVQVSVELGEAVTVNSGGVETRLAGTLEVTMDPTGKVLAHGDIQLTSGSYRAYGTKLQIRQGVLSYQGGPIGNPGLRIFAAREVGAVLAGVQVTGSAEAPVVTLYSRPSMPERDILAYILMGRALRSDSLDTDLLIMGAGTLLPGDGEGLSRWGIAEIDIQGLFAGLGGVRLRRQLTENWEVESTLGVESGIDLYYIIEFE